MKKVVMQAVVWVIQIYPISSLDLRTLILAKGRNKRMLNLRIKCDVFRVNEKFLAKSHNSNPVKNQQVAINRGKR